MTIPSSCLWLIGLAAIAASFDAGAGVYKCIDANGSVTYAQTPCPNQVTTSVATSSNDRSSTAMDCKHARQFSLSVARSMQQGMRSADVFDQYGGIAALSKSAVNVINYVYVFQHSSDVTADRIAGLASNKCKARAFGDINCDAMPSAYVDQIGGCDVDQQDPAEAGPAIASKVLAPQAAAVARQDTRSGDSSAREQRALARQAQLRAADLREECRDRVQSDIDRINARMRSGYSSSQGEQYRQRLHTLRRTFNDC